MNAITTKKLPTIGIGYGQRGSWCNRHFASQEKAIAAFEKYLEEIRKIYGTPGHNWTGKFIEENDLIAEGSTVLRAIKFTPLKKNGKRGATIHKAILYPITQQTAEILIKNNPIYSVEDWQD